MILFITPTHGSELTGSYTSFVYIGYATITYETLFYAATLSLKYFTLLPFTLIFIYTTDPSKFVSSLSKFRIHYKITYAINIALRYIPDIQSEYKVIKHAQEARGVAFEKGEASLWVHAKPCLNFLAFNYSFFRENRYSFKRNGFKRIWKEGYVRGSIQIKRKAGISLLYL